MSKVLTRNFLVESFKSNPKKVKKQLSSRRFFDPKDLSLRIVAESCHDKTINYTTWSQAFLLFHNFWQKWTALRRACQWQPDILRPKCKAAFLATKIFRTDGVVRRLYVKLANGNQHPYNAFEREKSEFFEFSRTFWISESEGSSKALWICLVLRQNFCLSPPASPLYHNVLIVTCPKC